MFYYQVRPLTPLARQAQVDARSVKRERERVTAEGPAGAVAVLCVKGVTLAG